MHSLVYLYSVSDLKPFTLILVFHLEVQSVSDDSLRIGAIKISDFQYDYTREKDPRNQVS